MSFEPVDRRAFLGMGGMAILCTIAGQEVRLEIVPVDPRDLFRGDYVVLGYRIGTVDLPKDTESSFSRGQKVFVTLRLDANNKTRAVAISAERPAVSGSNIGGL